MSAVSLFRPTVRRGAKAHGRSQQERSRSPLCREDAGPNEPPRSGHSTPVTDSRKTSRHNSPFPEEDRGGLGDDERRQPPIPCIFKDYYNP